MSHPRSRGNSARKSAARRYQREHPGSNYTHALAQTSSARASTDSLARAWDAGRYQAALLSGGAALVDASARISDALTGRSDIDQLRLMDAAVFGQWLALKMDWLHMVGELCRGPFAMPESTLPAFDVDEPVFPGPLTDTAGLADAGAVLAEAVGILEWTAAANQHPDVQPAGFGEAAAQVRRIFEWVCPTNAAQDSARRTANERMALSVRRLRQGLRRQN